MSSRIEQIIEEIEEYVDSCNASGIPRKTDISNAKLHGNCSGRL